MRGNRWFFVIPLDEGIGVRAFGIGSMLGGWNVCGWCANNSLDNVGQFLDFSFCERRCFGCLVGLFLETLRTPITMLRLLIAVALG